MSYSIMFFNPNSELICEKNFSGEQCIENFVDYLVEVEEELMGLLKSDEELVMTEENRTDLRLSKTCGICRKGFEQEDKRCADHDHFTGKYLWAAHMSCNLRRRRAFTIPLVRMYSYCITYIV